MQNQPSENELYMMLGEMRADLKYLVSERQQTTKRLADMEESHAAHSDAVHERITKLEHFRTKIGVVTAALGIVVPTGITALFHKLGLL